MSCEEIKKLLLEADGFENGNLSDEIKSHIESCSECRAFLSELRMMKKTLAECSVVPEKNGVALHDALSERIKNGDIQPLVAPEKRRIPIGTIAAAVAVVAIVIFSGTPLKSIFGSMLPTNSTKADQQFAVTADYSDSVSESESEAFCEITAMPEEEDSTGNNLKMAKTDNSEDEMKSSDGNENAEEADVLTDTEIFTVKSFSTANDSTDSNVVGESTDERSLTDSEKLTVGRENAAPALGTASDNGGVTEKDSPAESGLSQDGDSADEAPKSMFTLSMTPPTDEAFENGGSENTEAYNEGSPSNESAASNEISPSNGGTASNQEAPSNESTPSFGGSASSNDAFTGEDISEEEETDSAETEVLPSNDGLFLAGGVLAPLSVDEMLLTAKDYFAENPCPTPDEHDHSITVEMVKEVEEEGFREWFSLITDFEAEYTVSAFNRHFGLPAVNE